LTVEAHRRLEEAFARFAGTTPDRVVAANSGGSALHVAFEALGLPLGSEVACCDFNMVAVPRGIALAGHTPVLVDCRDDLLIDPDLLDEACAKGEGRVRAIAVTHVYGRVAAMGEVHALARKYAPCAVLEDLAEAHGTAPHPDTDASVWSLFRNKHLTTSEEGGLAAFLDPAHAAVARELRCLGFGPDHDYTHRPRGISARLANSLAEKALASLADYAGNLLERRLAERWYDRECPEAWRMPPRACPWVYDLRLPGLTRAGQKEAVKALCAEGIQARMSFAPMHLQEEFRGCRRVSGRVAEKASQEVFYLPLTPGEVTERSARRAFEVIRELAGENGKPGA
jgi:dTDP-4-amino-4,6-dideoxygalactose transaminase